SVLGDAAEDFGIATEPAAVRDRIVKLERECFRGVDIARDSLEQLRRKSFVSERREIAAKIEPRLGSGERVLLPVDVQLSQGSREERAQDGVDVARETIDREPRVRVAALVARRSVTGTFEVEGSEGAKALFARAPERETLGRII